jgi:hypothetical protein
MGFLDIFRKKETKAEEYHDLETQVEELPTKEPLKIYIDVLTKFSDTERIIRNIRAGHVVFAKIKNLKAMDVGELKRAVTKMRTIAAGLGGDIAGVGEDWLIITPERVGIDRK